MWWSWPHYFLDIMGPTDTTLLDVSGSLLYNKVVIGVACFHPLKAWQIGINPSGKPKLKITGFDVHHLELRNGAWLPITESFLSPYREKSVMKYTEIPCGKCVGCRLEYSRQWANRCMLENQYHADSYFVTLTYNDDSVPLSFYADPSTGEAMQAMTLDKRDFQLWMKRLRKAVVKRDGGSLSDTSGSSNIRYFASGEYGSQTYRPHYHAILFGLTLYDLVPYKKVRGFTYYTSEFLNRTWMRSSSFSSEKFGEYTSPKMLPKGFVVVAPVSWETCAYVARYVMKKAIGNEKIFYDTFNMQPPFSLMSRRPGIGRQWYDEHPDCFDYDFINISTNKGGLKFRPPKYFERLYEFDFPLKAASLKETRKRQAEVAKKLSLENTDMSYLDYLQVKENNLNSRIKSLRREL